MQLPDPLHFGSPAQLAGYAACLFGVTAFLQRDDRRLKLFLVAECASYVVHFLLLGNPPAASSSGVSGLRTLLSLRYRSRALAVLAMLATLSLGAALAKAPVAWLPVVGSCFASWGILTMRGIPMRLMVFVGTLLWLANNILSGSVGGTILESFITLASITTMMRLVVDARRAPLRALGGAPE